MLTLDVVPAAVHGSPAPMTPQQIIRHNEEEWVRWQDELGADDDEPETIEVVHGLDTVPQ